jgi:hypothetical protein
VSVNVQIMTSVRRHTALIATCQEFILSFSHEPAVRVKRWGFQNIKMLREKITHPELFTHRPMGETCQYRRNTQYQIISSFNSELLLYGEIACYTYFSSTILIPGLLALKEGSFRYCYTLSEAMLLNCTHSTDKN